MAATRAALAMGGGTAKSDAAAPEDVNGHKFLGQVVEGLDPKGLRAAVDEMKKRLGSGIGALVAVNEGRASVAVGVTDDLSAQVSAVDLVKAAVEALFKVTVTEVNTMIVRGRIRRMGRGELCLRRRRIEAGVLPAT